MSDYKFDRTQFFKLQRLQDRIANTYHNRGFIFGIDGASVFPEMIITKDPKGIKDTTYQFGAVNPDYKYGMIQLSQCSVVYASKDAKHFCLAVGVVIEGQPMDPTEIVESLEENGAFIQFRKEKPKEMNLTIKWHPYPEEKPKKCGDYLVTAVFDWEKTMKPDLKKKMLDEGYTPDEIRDIWEVPEISICYFYNVAAGTDDADEWGDEWHAITDELPKIPDHVKITAWAEMPSAYYRNSK